MAAVIQICVQSICSKASGATVDNLNKDKVASAIMPLPPLAEQRRIANRIEELIQLL